MVADPNRLSRNTVRQLLLDIHTSDEAVTIGVPKRAGWTIIVDVAVNTPSIWDAPQAIISP